MSALKTVQALSLDIWVIFAFALHQGGFSPFGAF